MNNLMSCLHLIFCQGKNLLRSSYLTLVHSSSVYSSSNNSSWSVNTPAICIIYVMKSNWREILKPCSLQEVKWWLSWLPTVTMPDHRVITTFTLVKFRLSFAAFTEVLVSVYTRKMFTWVSKLSYLSKPFKSKHGISGWKLKNPDLCNDRTQRSAIHHS